MLRISKLADYGTILMVLLAREPESVYTAKDLATASHIALPTVAKLLKLLAQAGLLHSQRGARGGYSLSQDPNTVTVAHILKAIDGDLGLTECSMAHSECAIEHHCIIRGNWRLISQAIHQALDSVSLANLAKVQMHKNDINTQPITALKQQIETKVCGDDDV